jgi:hypothetical protein
MCDSLHNSRANSPTPVTNSHNTGEIAVQPAGEVDGNTPETSLMSPSSVLHEEVCDSREDFLPMPSPSSDTAVDPRQLSSNSTKKSKESKNVVNNIASFDRPSNAWTLEAPENCAFDRAAEICTFGRRTVVETWLIGEFLSTTRVFNLTDTGVLSSQPN